MCARIEAALMLRASRSHERVGVSATTPWRPHGRPRQRLTRTIGRLVVLQMVVMMGVWTFLEDVTLIPFSDSAAPIILQSLDPQPRYSSSYSGLVQLQVLRWRNLLRPPRPPWAALCSVTSDQDLVYLDDWVDYHLALGFGHIYLYDVSPRFSLSTWYAHRTTRTNDTNDTNDDWDVARRVHVYHAKVMATDEPPHALYQECRDRLRDLVRPPHWVAALRTVHEYLVLDRSVPNVPEFLMQQLPSGTTPHALCAIRHTMGSGHEIEYRAEPVTRRFQLAVSNDTACTQPIAALDAVEKWNGVNFTTTRASRLDDRGACHHCVASIYHYRYRSYDEYHETCHNTRQRVNATCPALEMGDTLDDAAWFSTKRFLPRYKALDRTSSWTLPVLMDYPPLWAALCVVMEASDHLYIDEWLDYHLALGFEHVYVYGGNTSRNGTRSQPPRPYRITHSARRVTMLNVTGDTEYLVAHCLARLHKVPTPPKWIMSLSVDEFLVIRDADRYPNVVSFLSEHVPSGSLQISRIVMGSSNATTAHANSPVTQRFLYAVRGSHHSETRPVAVWDHIEALGTFSAVHKPGYAAVGMGGRRIAPDCCITEGDVSVAAIYHYLYQSASEYRYGRYNGTREVEIGDDFDDSAWRALWRLVPKYRFSWAAICSAMLDEERYIDEWTDYHLALGFDHIFIYDTHPNNTLASWHADQQTKEAEQEKHNQTIKARRVHVIHHAKQTDSGFQESVYNACLDRLRALVHPPKWVLVIDADEYLVLRDMDRYPNVTAFLSEHVPTGVVQLNWNTMGSGHHIAYRDEPVTRRFQLALLGEKWNVFTKAAAVLDHIESWNVHDATPKAGFTVHGMGGRVGEEGAGKIDNGDTTVAAIFHYKYKSYDEYNQKQCVRGDIMPGRVIVCPTFVEVGEKWDEAAWHAMKRLLPNYAQLDSTVAWNPVVMVDPPVWAALCAVVAMDEDRYLDEWLDYHLALGFEHIYIYGGSMIYDDALSSRLGKRQYKEAHEDNPPHTTTARRVAIVNTKGDPESLLADCVGELAKLPTPPKWVMTLSVDQFLVIRDMDRYPNVISFLLDHVPSGSLQISRIVMGSANETTYQDVPVTRRFQYAVRGSHHSETRPVAVLDHIQAIKTFYAVPKPGYHSTGMGGRALAESECCITDGDASVAAIYHYLYRSVEEYNCDASIYNCTPEVEIGDAFDDSAWQAMLRLVPKYAVRSMAHTTMKQPRYR